MHRDVKKVGCQAEGREFYEHLVGTQCRPWEFKEKHKNSSGAERKKRYMMYFFWFLKVTM